ncbi:myosin-Vc [Camelus ferus]|nr:myosin-Vc [Camelus ferus]
MLAACMEERRESCDPVTDPEEVWKSAEIAKDYRVGDRVLRLLLEDGMELDYPIDPESLPPLRNPDILVGENDLTALSYLHEPAVLHNLRIRFAESKLIYTYSGIILVAMNPYKQLPIYGDAIIHAYSGQNVGDMDPHIFAVAEEAYKQMARNNKNQSIIVSGESGAGKTVSARYAMRYFATVSKSSSNAHVEDKVLASNPITEAVGNAKTTRNDNSSRFGKYTEISFDERNQIIGANMRTYLLEKSRVVFQSENERNYHIFYQLCASAQQSEFKHLKLGSAEEFHYTRMGGSTVIEGVNDRADMIETQKTFRLLGFKEDFQMDVFKILAAILHLGNVQITAVGNERSTEGDSHLKVFCELLGLEGDKVAQWLCNRKIITASETVVKPMTRPQAANARDALAKKIYAHLFDFIVERINQALQFSGKQHTFIGVLDIYGVEMTAPEVLPPPTLTGPEDYESTPGGGKTVLPLTSAEWGNRKQQCLFTKSLGVTGSFETFDVNSFEQFCINYANEKLQQQFNLLPHGTDENWLQKLYNNFVNKNSLFEKPRMSNTSFIIQHFADKVEYKCEGFLEKNRDTVYDMLVEILRASKFHLCASFFQENPAPSSPFSSAITVKSAKPVIKSNNKHFRSTVGSKFRSSLYLLMETLNATTPHYVRCIKPNDEKLPFEFDSRRIVQQLRACGVLETIRISAQSYPSRWTYIEFYSRYGILMTKQELSFSDKQEVCRVVLHRLIQDSNQYQLGKTKIFFRAGQVAYLEKLRLDKLRQGCVVIQKHIRGWLQRKKFLRERGAALVIQRYFRGQQTVRRAVTARTLKEAWAAIVIQKYCRGYLVRNLYQLIRVATITIQAYTRGFLARRRYRKMLEQHKAVILQKYARAWLARRRFQNIRRFVLNIQLTYRVQRLQKKLEDQNKENHGLVEKLTSLAALRAGDVEKIQKLESELDRAAAHRHNYEEKGRRYKASVEEKLATLQKHNSELETQKEQIQLKLQEKTEEMKDSAGLFASAVRAQQTLSVPQDLLDRLQEYRRVGCKPGAVVSEGGGVCGADDLGIGVCVRVSDEQEEVRGLLLEKSFELKTQDYEKQIRSLKEEIKSLKSEKMQLQHQLEEERVTSDGLKGEVARLSQQAKTISEFEKEIELLQTQKIDVEKHVQSQKREMREQMSEITRQLLESYDIEDVRSRLSVEDLEHLNEDGELWFAYEGLKKATRVLESHFQSQKDCYEKEIEALNFKVAHLSQEINHLQKLFREENDINESIRHEVTRLTSENMMIPDFKQQISELEKQKQDLEIRLTEQNESMKGKLEELSHQLNRYREEEGMQRKTVEAQNEIHTTEKEKLMDTSQEMQETGEHLKKQFETESEVKSSLRHEASHLTVENRSSLFPYIKRQVVSEVTGAAGEPGIYTDERGGVDLEEELDMKDRVIKKLQDQVKILTKTIEKDLKPRGVVVNMIPGLPAHILFMCVRYADSLNDASMLKSLMNSTINGIKQVVKEFMKHNSPHQNKNCLNNFDLSEYRQILSDVAIRIYHQFIIVMENNIQPIIVPGMLEFESLQGISGLKPTGFRKRSSSIDDTDAYTMTSILQQLSYFYSTMCQNGLDPEIVRQAVKQLFFLIGAVTLNSLFLRKDMCSCRKGMQIRVASTGNS